MSTDRDHPDGDEEGRRPRPGGRDGTDRPRGRQGGRPPSGGFRGRDGGRPARGSSSTGRTGGRPGRRDGQPGRDSRGERDDNTGGPRTRGSKPFRGNDAESTGQGRFPRRGGTAGKGRDDESRKREDGRRPGRPAGASRDDTPRGRPGRSAGGRYDGKNRDDTPRGRPGRPAGGRYDGKNNQEGRPSRGAAGAARSGRRDSDAGGRDSGTGRPPSGGGKFPPRTFRTPPGGANPGGGTARGGESRRRDDSAGRGSTERGEQRSFGRRDGGRPGGRGGERGRRPYERTGGSERDGRRPTERGARRAFTGEGRPASETRPRRDLGPSVPDEVTGAELDRDAASELRTLPKDLATDVARHLVMAGRLLDEDADLAYQHALAARRRAARVGVVREACGLAAYHAGLWSVALSELRAARRLSGQEAYLAIMADAERGLGRPERALDLARSDEARRLPQAEAIEMRIVESGARRDLGEHDAAVLALQVPELKDERLRPWSARLFYAYADALAAAGREEESANWFARAAAADRDGETDAAERYAEIEGLDIVDDDE